MVRASSVLALLLAVSAAGQTPPPVGKAPAGQDSPGLVSKQLPNHAGGIVTYYSGNRLKDEESQTATNVFFDKDSGVVKRSGQVLYGNIPCSAQVRSMAEYDSPNGEAYFLAACGGNVYVSLGTGSWAVLGGTISATANVYFAQGMGFEWVTDGVDSLWSTNGVTVSSYPYPGSITGTGQAPLAQLVSVFQDRLALANVSGGQSAVYLAGYNSGSVGTSLDFTLPSVLVDTSAAIFGLNGLNDGLQVTCMSAAYRNVLILWDHNTMYGLYGSGYSTFILREIGEIGCDEQQTVQEFDGKLYWLSQYGEYEYDGLNHRRVSDPIKDQILNIIGTEPGQLSITQDQQTDWQGGNLTASGPGAPMSDTIDPGNVVASTWAKTDAPATNLNGVYTSFTTATVNGISLSTIGISKPGFEGDNTLGGWTDTASIFSNSNNALCSTGISCYGAQSEVAAEKSGQWNGTTANFNVYNASNAILLSVPMTLTANSCATPAMIDVSTLTATLIRIGVSSPGSGAQLISSSFLRPQGFVSMAGAYNSGACLGGGVVYFDTPDPYYASSGTYTSAIFDTSFSTPIFAFSPIEVNTPSSGTITYNTQTATATTGVFTLSNSTTANREFAQYVATLWGSTGSTNVNNVQPTLQSMDLQASTTGYFITSCFNTSPIVGWGLFQSGNDQGNGTVTYAVSSGTTCNAVEQTTATWTAQTDFTNVAIATAPFLGVRVLFSGTTYFAPDDQPTFTDITVNWQSSAGRPRSASQVFDNRYWLAYTTSTSGTAYNNSVLVFDSEGHWSGPFVGINAASLQTYQRVLYSGSSLGDGNVNIQNTGTNDLGNPILYDFKTPDYELDAFNTVDLYDLNLEFLAVPAGYSPNLQVQYYVDQGTTPYSLGTVPLTIGTRGLIYANARFPLNGSPIKAHTLSFELIDDTPTPLTFYRSMIRYTPEDGP